MFLIFMWDMIYQHHVGGELDINNLKPICARCNLSMSDNYTIKEWTMLSKPKKKCKDYFNCFCPQSSE